MPEMTIEEKLATIEHFNRIWEFDPTDGDIDKLVANTRAAIEALDAQIETTPLDFGNISYMGHSDSRKVSGMILVQKHKMNLWAKGKK